MKHLLRRAIALSREHPQLFLPTIVAAFLGAFWRRIGLIVSHQIILWTTSSGSVLDGSSGGLSRLSWLSYLPVPLAYFIDVSCFIIAMILTASMVRSFAVPEVHTSLPKEISLYRVSSIAWLALQVCLLCIAIFALIAPASNSFILSTHHRSLLTNPVVLSLEILPLYLGLAYFLTPATLRLLASITRAKIDEHRLALGRQLSIATGALITVLSFLSLSLSPSFRITPTQATAFSTAATIVIALPYTPLFIALTLLAMQGQEPVGELASQEVPSAAEAATDGDGDWHD